MFTPQSRNAMRKFISTDKNYGSLMDSFHVPEKLRAEISKPEVSGAVSAKTKKADADVAVAEKDDSEIKKYYTLNETGNIMISSTVKDSKDISEDVQNAFKKVIVFFTAWTAALSKKEKTLYDAEAITNIIEQSGFFVRVHKEERTFNYISASGTLNTAIIGSVLSGFSAMGGALKIAQTVVGSMGAQLAVSASHGESTKKIGHLLFICENLMGMPIVNVVLLNTTAKESETVTKSNCHSSVNKNMSMTYRQDAFLFADPTYINQFSDEFKTNPDFEKLIDQLASYIK